MASTDGTSGGNAGAGGAGTPATLASEIERTREDLAETLDAIAEKVSPKRVAKRTSKKAADVVKEATTAAREVVVSGAHSAKDAVVAGAETAKDKVAAAKAGGGTPVPSSGSVAPAGDSLVTSVQVAPDLGADALPPVAGVPVPELGTARPGAATSSAPLRTAAAPHPAALAGGGALKNEYLAAGVVVLALGLLVRWRSRST